MNYQQHLCWFVFVCQCQCYVDVLLHYKGLHMSKCVEVIVQNGKGEGGKYVIKVRKARNVSTAHVILESYNGFVLEAWKGCNIVVYLQDFRYDF